MSEPLPPYQSTAWYAHYAALHAALAGAGNLPITTEFGRSMLSLADAAALRTALGTIPTSHWLYFSMPGNLVVGAGISPVPILANGNITAYRTKGITAPTGSAAIFDINKNGSTMFTTGGNRPTVAAGATVSSLTLPDIVAVAAGDYLTVDIDQIGSGTAGADFVLGIQITES